jgi:RNA polymerase primary sigma factor
MSSLLLRERQVLDMRFGMNGEEEHTLGDVADTFCITPERVRQIETKALRKMRHPERAKPLREFIEK